MTVLSEVLPDSLAGPAASAAMAALDEWESSYGHFAYREAYDEGFRDGYQAGESA